MRGTPLIPMVIGIQVCRRSVHRIGAASWNRPWGSPLVPAFAGTSRARPAPNEKDSLSRDQEPGPGIEALFRASTHVASSTWPASEWDKPHATCLPQSPCDSGKRTAAPWWGGGGDAAWLL